MRMNTAMKRREFIATGALIVGSTLAPTTRRGWLGWSPPDDAIDHSGGRYSWSVQVGNDALDTLESWVEDDDDRELVWTHDETGFARIIATPGDIGLRRLDFSDGLKDFGWIRSIEVDVERRYAEPVRPDDSDVWRGIRNREQWAIRLSSLSGADAPDSGVAFDEDMEETTLEEALQVTGAGDISDFPDTSDLTLAVIDTGINPGEPFEDDGGNSRILDNSKEFITDDREEGVSAVEDQNLHGTAVTSYAASNADDDAHVGYAPDCDILALKALDDDGSGATSSIVHAILYAAEEGADVICMSLGSPLWSESMHHALEWAVDEHDCIPVAAAGNDRQATRWVAAPASSSYTITVGAVTADDPEDAKSAYFSNIGPHPGTTDDSGGQSADMGPDVAAPGTESTALTPRHTGSVTEETYTGTSMAAPKVAGVVLQVIADAGVTDFEEMREWRIRENAEPIPNAGETEVGAGMVNAEQARSDDHEEVRQGDERDDEAVTRDEAYEALSDASGGAITRRLL